MAKKPTVHYDEIGYWSEVKLDIIRKYAGAYTRASTYTTATVTRSCSATCFRVAGMRTIDGCKYKRVHERPKQGDA